MILYILTNAYHTSSDFQAKIDAFVETDPSFDSLRNASGVFPSVQVLPMGLPAAHMPCLYKAVDAFVLPSRGEGWGRPHVEAMAMGLPVIATHWSGTTEYMTESNSYPLRIDGLVEIQDGPFKGHRWAEPSVSHLRELLRSIVERPDEAGAKGKLARQDMIEKYCVECLNRNITERIRKIKTVCEVPSVTPEPADEGATL